MLSRIRRSPMLVVSIVLMCVAVVVTALIIINNRRFKGQVLRDEKVTVQLSSSAHPEQLTFENDLVRIEVGCDQYFSYLDMKTSDDSLPESYRTDLEELKASIEAANSCNVGEALLHEHAIADILEQGMGSVYDKHNQARAPTVKIWFYEFFCGPLCGEGSRSFYLPDGTLFLRVTDWIS
jgi:hypothetical protein